MADRPMIFSAAMVRAMLDGRKTQTRLVLRVQPDDADAILYTEATFPQFCLHGYATFSRRCAPPQHVKFPYAPGDRLWVKETWGDRYAGEIAYKADDDVNSPIQWRSPRFMPRWASRLTLPVTDVRVQRVQEISEADAVAEGVVDYPRHCYRPACLPVEWRCDVLGCLGRREQFRDVWNSIHGPDAWDRNDWIAALTFDVARRNIDAPPLPHVGGA